MYLLSLPPKQEKEKIPKTKKTSEKRKHTTCATV
jgi:hypothetical protein